MRSNSFKISVVVAAALLAGVLVGRYVPAPDDSDQLAAIETNLADITARMDAAELEVDGGQDHAGYGSGDPIVQGALRSLADRLNALEANLEVQRDAGTVGHREILKDTRPRAADLIESGEATLETFSSPESILSSFSGQRGSSRWGEAASESITQAYMSEFPRGDFFLNYGGSVSADCRETVCRVDLKLDQSVAQLDGYELAQALQFGELELMGLARHVRGVGTMTTSVQGTPERPIISLYFDGKTLDSQPNDAASGLSKMSR